MQAYVVFTDLFVWQRERLFNPMVHSPSRCSCWGWAGQRPEPGASLRSSAWVYASFMHPHVVANAEILGLYCTELLYCCTWSGIARTWNSNDTGCRNPKLWLNSPFHNTRLTFSLLKLGIIWKWLVLGISQFKFPNILRKRKWECNVADPIIYLNCHSINNSHPNCRWTFTPTCCLEDTGKKNKSVILVLKSNPWEHNIWTEDRFGPYNMRVKASGKCWSNPLFLCSALWSRINKHSLLLYPSLQLWFWIYEPLHKIDLRQIFL